MLMKLWNDEAGFTVALELILIAVILVIALVTGLSAVRNAMLGELDELADAILAINQSYSVGGSSEQCAMTGMTTFSDLPGQAQVTLCTQAVGPT
jgi:Flp pilus assembly pilin Flp